MDVNTITQLISSVGFPIAACFAMGWFIVWDKKSRREEAKERDKTQTDMLQQLKETVERNTEMVEKLITKLEVNGND